MRTIFLVQKYEDRDEYYYEFEKKPKIDMEYDKCSSIRLVKDNWVKVFELIKKCEQFEHMIEGNDT